MKFFQALTLATLGAAVPAVVLRDELSPGQALDKRVGISDTLQSTVGTLTNITSGNLAVINTTLQNVADSVDAQLKVVINANLAAIEAALKNASTAIATTTVGGASTVLSGLVGLTKDQINAILSSLQSLVALLGQVKATVSLTAKNVTPDVLSAIKSELNAVTNALQPFVGPLLTLTAALQGEQVTGNVNVSGVGNLVKGVASLVQALATGLL